MRHAIKLPHVYIDGLKINRKNVATRLGDAGNSDKLLREVELESFGKVASSDPVILDMIERLQKSPSKRYNKLGEVGALEVLGKLGIFLSLIPDYDLYKG